MAWLSKLLPHNMPPNMPHHPAPAVAQQSPAQPTVLDALPPHATGSVATALGSGQAGQPGASSQWQAAWCSHTGTRHLAQGRGCEDSVALRAHASGALCMGLADGVSQGARGEVVSQALVQHCIAAPEPSQALDAAAQCQQYQLWLQSAERHVQAALQAVTQARGAATLACAWLSADGQAFLSRVGDCRVYAWAASPGGISVTLLRPDQSFASLQETPPLGVAPSNPARMVGINAMGTPEVWHTHIAPSAGLLLCSDGVHDVLSAQALAQLIQTHWLCPPVSTPLAAQHHATDTAHAIVQQALVQGSDDDISVLLVQRVATPSLQATLIN